MVDNLLLIILFFFTALWLIIFLAELVLLVTLHWSNIFLHSIILLFLFLLLSAPIIYFSFNHTEEGKFSISVGLKVIVTPFLVIVTILYSKIYKHGTIPTRTLIFYENLFLFCYIIVILTLFILAVVDIILVLWLIISLYVPDPWSGK